DAERAPETPARLAAPVAVAVAPIPAWNRPDQLARGPPPPPDAWYPPNAETLEGPDQPSTNSLMAPATGREPIATAPSARPATPAARSASWSAVPPFFCHTVNWSEAFFRFFVAVASSAWVLASALRAAWRFALACTTAGPAAPAVAAAAWFAAT